MLLNEPVMIDGKRSVIFTKVTSLMYRKVMKHFNLCPELFNDVEFILYITVIKCF